MSPMRELEMNKKQRIGPKLQRPLAVVFGVALLVAGLAVGTRGPAGEGDTASRWVVFGLFLAGVLAMTWSPSRRVEDRDIAESPTAHYTRSSR
ncbi:MAG: hypothetical protein QG597_2987 [Actinomycetota bacterium]|nr:hypothetical protein [Actinomycetota bacterium]